jgi:DNA-binding CsgD family transcriptional regulator
MVNRTADQLRQYRQRADHVLAIIEPMQAVDIVGSFYTRVYPDGTAINLASDADWTDHYFHQLSCGAYSAADIAGQYATHSGMSLWELNATNKVWCDAKHYFNYGNGATLLKDFGGFQELVGFYSTANNSAINQFFINQLDSLEKLREYFLLKAVSLIEEAEQERMLLLTPVFPHTQGKILLSQVSHNTSFIKTDAMHSAIQAITSGAPLNTTDQPICVISKKTNLPMVLSPQRGLCLLYLTQGQSAKEIARLMKLSVKTVEHYLAILRRELGCSSSRELIASYGEQLNKELFNWLS